MVVTASIYRNNRFVGKVKYDLSTWVVGSWALVVGHYLDPGHGVYRISTLWWK